MLNFPQHQYLTLLSLEVHTVTREDLLPDPEYDSIAALFYAIYNDVSMDTNEQIEHGNYQNEKKKKKNYIKNFIILLSRFYELKIVEDFLYITHKRLL